MNRLEQETIVLFNEAEPHASVYTYNGALKRKLSNLCRIRPEEARQTKDDGNGGITFEVPKRWIKVNAGPLLSDEERARRASAIKARFTSKSQ